MSNECKYHDDGSIGCLLWIIIFILLFMGPCGIGSNNHSNCNCPNFTVEKQ
jgi:hypothetical protein